MINRMVVTPQSAFVLFQPGDGTRYRMVFTLIPGSAAAEVEIGDVDQWLVGLFDADGMLKSHPFARGRVPHHDYIREKLKCCPHTAIVMMWFLQTYGLRLYNEMCDCQGQQWAHETDLSIAEDFYDKQDERSLRMELEAAGCQMA